MYSGDLGLPRRIKIGIALTLAVLFSPILFQGDYLNALTISLQIVNYIFWAYTITLLHTEVRAIDSGYPFGPRESMVGALIPFSYIFWNFYWISVMWERLEMGAHSFRYSHYFVGLSAAVASVLCFPDNLDKIPSLVPTLSFVILYTTTWLFTRRIRELLFEQSL
tara:strand:- start:281 stop:775 length:495 start_codon:yes stop_codon:yes gene_type:complete